MITTRFARALPLLALLSIPLASGAASIGTGGFHSLAVHADGTVRTWGDDSAGALGVGRSLTSPAPVAVPGLTNVAAVGAGGNHTVVLKSDGTVWAWGANDAGELGDGSTTSRSVPAQVVGLTGVTKIAIGRFHNLALRSDNTVWAWGRNNAGELGDDGPDRPIAAPVAGMTNAVEIAAGSYHSLVRKADGTVWAFGWNADGQLGDGHPAEPWERNPAPVVVTGLTGVTQLSGGSFHSVALKSDGSVWAWGNNKHGTIGDGTFDVRSTPTRVSGLADVVEVSAGTFYTAVRKRDGTIWAWGEGGYCNLGDGTCDDRPLPVPLATVTDVAHLVVGFVTTLALRTDGGLWAWGYNNGVYGDGTNESSSTPVRVAGVSGIAAVALGEFHAVARRTDGTVLTWGDNAQGQLGNAVLTFRSTPSIVAGLPPVTAVAGALYHSLALATDGSVYAWGSNLANQFHDESIGHSTPQKLDRLGNVTAIAAGAFHSLAIISDRTVRSWGSNYRGLLGIGNDGSTSDVETVKGLTEVVRIAGGGGHSLAVRVDGSVWAWGQNDYGQVGDGTNEDRNAPVRVQGITDAVRVAAGPEHSLALLRDGTVVAWGRAYEGQLGDGGDIPNRPTPVRVPFVTGATDIATGRDFSLALAGGRVWVWGTSYNGGTGCADCDTRTRPIVLPGLERIVAIASFQYHVLALRDDGAVLAFGGNRLGQLGDGTLVDRLEPVVVLHEGGTGSVAGNDWFLDLDPGVATTIPPEKVPVFLVVASSQASNVVADIKYRSQDVGTSASTFVFALAPATMVKGATAAKDARIGWKASGAPKDGPVSCALAQLNSQGQLVAVSAQSLQAYVSGVLSGQAQSVDILKNVPPANVAGAIFYVGYGANGNAMLVNGTTRSVVSVPGSLTCKPAAPQTGWWYNPAEGGRGFSIEARGNRLFMAAFHYDASGRATWNFAGGATSLDGSLFTADFLGASGGQTLTGPYKLPGLSTVGPITFAFSDSSHGTMSWPGGLVAIERQPLVPGGLTAPAQAGLPESGWWWNPAESGRGFFLEWQNGVVDIAGYMYDDAGNPTWYIGVYETPNPMLIGGNWWTFAGGQSMGGAYKPATRTSDNAGSLRVEFASATTATMTLPDGRRIPLERQPF